VGANIGWFSLLAASNSATVLSIEPMEYNLELMRASMRLNPGFDIRAVKADVSDVATSLEVQCMQPQSGGDPNTNQDNGQVRTFQGGMKCTEKTSLVTLDQVLADVDPVIMSHGVYVMKIDIEGYETKAVMGGRPSRTTRTSKTLVMICGTMARDWNMNL
tara:strand:+ start:3688 stop:4167 length:480 start_codon:yes stop_codon:yes gene_type:complete